MGPIQGNMAGGMIWIKSRQASVGQLLMTGSHTPMKPMRMVSAIITYAHRPRLRRCLELRPYLVALTLIVGGCAGSSGTIPPGPSMPSGMITKAATTPVTSFDGSYQTKIRAITSFGGGKDVAWCETSGQPIVTVENGQFTYTVPHSKVPMVTRSVFPATIAADGSFRGEIVAGTMSGRITGAHMEGRIDGSMCVYAFSGNRM